MVKYKANSLIGRFKTNFVSKCTEAKLRIILISAIVLACFVAGIIIYASSPYFFPGDEYLLSFEGVGNGVGAFFSRIFSLTVVTGLVFVFSLSKWSSFLGIVVIGFRGYLLGFNVSILCATFGMSGLLDAIFIVVPCQLCMLLCFVLMFAFLTKARCLCFNYGKGGRGRIVLGFWIALVLLNIIETILLFIFSSKVILVI